MTRNLLLKHHVQYLKTSCQKALDIHRVVGHADWGVDRIILLRLYRSLVRSKLDLRIALGAFRTSPAQSLYIEAHEPSLTTHRLKLS